LLGRLLELSEGLARSDDKTPDLPENFIAAGFGNESPQELAMIGRTLTEMIICMAVDNFNLYLSDLLHNLLRTKRMAFGLVTRSRSPTFSSTTQYRTVSRSV
jgi:hypothetical protein